VAIPVDARRRLDLAMRRVIPRVTLRKRGRSMDDID
jgi:hypothetical protein